MDRPASSRDHARREVVNAPAGSRRGSETPAKNRPGKIVAVDLEKFAEIFRQLAAKSQRAADESAAVVRMLTAAADKIESWPAVNTPQARRQKLKGTPT
jgi:hypothetical protein